VSLYVGTVLDSRRDIKDIRDIKDSKDKKKLYVL